MTDGLWERMPFERFPHKEKFPTRWNDNDQYGHLNNTVHYAAVDSAVNRLLMSESAFRPDSSEAIGLVVASGCRYFREATYPAILDLGLAVSRIGLTSVHYVAGLFGDDPRTGTLERVAVVTFSHVYVNRDTRESTPVPEYLRAAISPLVVVPVPVSVDADEGADRE